MAQLCPFSDLSNLYCNALYMAILEDHLEVTTSPAYINKCRSECFMLCTCSSVLHVPQRVRVAFWVQVKVLVITFEAETGMGPSY